MHTVEDCIKDINKKGSIFNIFKVFECENVFYETHRSGVPNGINHLLPELQKINNPTVRTQDGVKISVWDINPNLNSRYIIFCAGIGSEKSSLFLQKAYLKTIENGLGVLAFDYRGRGGSSGIFSQKGALTDIETLYEYLIQKGIKKENIGIIGHSMGCAVALDFATKTAPAFIALINPFNKAAEMAKSIAEKLNLPLFLKTVLRLLPPFLIPLKNEFNNEKALKKIKCPAIIIHSDKDPTISVRLARKLFYKNCKKQNIKYVELDCADHEITDKKMEICLKFVNSL